MMRCIKGAINHCHDAQADMAIHPLGHRQLLLQAIGRLKSPPADSSSASSSADGGDGGGRVPVTATDASLREARAAATRQQARLLSSLQRAEQMRAQHAGCAA